LTARVFDRRLGQVGLPRFRGGPVSSSAIQLSGSSVPKATGLIAALYEGAVMKALISIPLFALATIAPARAQAPQPVAVTVTLENFKFQPNPVQLRAGQPAVLHLVNTAGGGHSFTAPEFFAAAKIAPASQPLVRDGKVEVPKHSAVDIALTPVAGDFPLKCSHTLHAAFGMKGMIVVR
jgi:plastocyanin